MRIELTLYQKPMKKFLPLLAFSLMLASCNKPAGELVGTMGKQSFQEANPYGMVFVERGSFMMGTNNQSTVFSEDDNSLNVTVNAFWMDETEITNDEYKQFTNWVRDSLVLRALVNMGRMEYAIVPKDGDYDEETVRLNWKRKIPWTSKEPDIQDVLNEFKYSDGTFDYRSMLYTYKSINYDQASLLRNRYDVSVGRFPENTVITVDSSWVDSEGLIRDTTIVKRLRDRSDLVSTRIISVYPDTLVWVRDFQYAYNEPLLKMYFSHPGYAQYPVVGVTWEQANAFCNWRTAYFNGNNRVIGQDYRLPTEAEWEYAARGGKKMATYPWGGNYARDAKGCFLANFKPYRGNYAEDTGAMTMKVGTFKPNDYGLYDMAGNVSEWTSTAYNPSLNAWVSDINPSFQYNAKKNEAPMLKRKVIKGGSWKDIAYFLQCGSRSYEYQYESRSYIGFRCVRSYMGE